MCFVLCRLPSPNNLFQTTYCDPAPLTPLLNRLVQPAKCSQGSSSARSVFAIDNDTDYTVMKFYLYILGVATTNIKAYVELELQSAKKYAALPTEEKANAAKPEKDLETLPMAIVQMMMPQEMSSMTRRLLESI